MSAFPLKVNNILAYHLHGFSIILLSYFYRTYVRLLFTGTLMTIRQIWSVRHEKYGFLYKYCQNRIMKINCEFSRFMKLTKNCWCTVFVSVWKSQGFLFPRNNEFVTLYPNVSNKCPGIRYGVQVAKVTGHWKMYPLLMVLPRLYLQCGIFIWCHWPHPTS